VIYKKTFIVLEVLERDSYLWSIGALAVCSSFSKDWLFLLFFHFLSLSAQLFHCPFRNFSLSTKSR